MTRQQQNDIIIAKITEKLQDQPNIQVKLDETFTQWFQALAKAGIEQMKGLIKPQQAKGASADAPAAA